MLLSALQLPRGVCQAVAERGQGQVGVVTELHHQPYVCMWSLVHSSVVVLDAVAPTVGACLNCVESTSIHECSSSIWLFDSSLQSLLRRKRLFVLPRDAYHVPTDLQCASQWCNLLSLQKGPQIMQTSL
jgi:hypothetical protein